MKFRNYFIVLIITAIFWSCNTNANSSMDSISYSILKVRIDYNLEQISSRSPTLSAWMIPVNENLGIAQFGMVDLVTIDINTGNVIRRIDLEALGEEINQVVNIALGENYYMPDQEEYLKKRLYAGLLQFDFHNIIQWLDREAFATLIRAVIFNRLDEEEQGLLDIILLFNEKLDEFETFFIDPNITLPNNGLSNGGFFLGKDRLFTKLSSIHDETFDFLEYQLIEGNRFDLVDTLKDIITARMPNRSFHSTISLAGINYLNLGRDLYSYEGKSIREGIYRQFPVDSTLYCINFQGFDSDNFAVGYFVNDFSDGSDPRGELILIDSNLEMIHVLDTYDLTKHNFHSLFTVDRHVYVMNYDLTTNGFYLLKYTTIEPLE